MDLVGATLTEKALLALEEASQESRYRPVPRTLAIRFALAYLWALKPGNREPFDEFWRKLVDDTMWRFGGVDRALSCIYWQLGLERDHSLTQRMWAIAQARERGE